MTTAVHHDPFFGNWSTQGRAVGWESVTVPAGTFKALRVQLESQRHPIGSVAMRGQEPVRVAHVAWYAPEVKRTVKHVRTVWAGNGMRMEEDTYELVRFALN